MSNVGLGSTVEGYSQGGKASCLCEHRYYMYTHVKRIGNVHIQCIVYSMCQKNVSIATE